MPFNKGDNNGAGNPPNGGIKTDYLWKEILTKTNLTDIIQNFCQLITEEKEYFDDKGNSIFWDFADTSAYKFTPHQLP